MAISEWQVKQYAVQRQYMCKVCGLLGHSSKEIINHALRNHTEKQIKGEEELENGT